jgi:mono/diheme cytochrome c family protein
MVRVTSSRAARWRHALAGCIVIAAVALGGGCGGDDDSDAGTPAAKTTPAMDPEVRAERMRIGARVFDEHCHACHTLLGRKHAPITSGEPPGPNFDEVRPNRPYLRERVESGGIAMQSFTSEIGERGKRAVVLYVAEVSGRNIDPDDSAGSDEELTMGRQVFMSTCHACHGIENRHYTGPLENHGIDFDGVKPSVRWVTRMIRNGNAFMKPIRGLSDEQIEAIAKYVSSVAGNGRGEI